MEDEEYDAREEVDQDNSNAGGGGGGGELSSLVVKVFKIPKGSEDDVWLNVVEAARRSNTSYELSSAYKNTPLSDPEDFNDEYSSGMVVFKTFQDADFFVKGSKNRQIAVKGKSGATYTLSLKFVPNKDSRVRQFITDRDGTSYCPEDYTVKVQKPDEVVAAFGIPCNEDWDDVVQACAQHGEILRSNYKNARRPGGSKFGFMFFKNLSDAEDLVKKYDGIGLVIRGKERLYRIRLDYHQPKPYEPPPQSRNRGSENNDRRRSQSRNQRSRSEPRRHRRSRSRSRRDERRRSSSPPPAPPLSSASLNSSSRYSNRKVVYYAIPVEEGSSPPPGAVKLPPNFVMPSQQQHQHRSSNNYKR